MFRIRAFRAMDDFESCIKFMEGHTRVLQSIGINKVTSNTESWITNPNVYVIIVEGIDGQKVYGGARVHRADFDFPLPIQEAVMKMDDRIMDLVYSYIPSGTGEICGLWNSREVAGFGLGSIFLTRAGVAICDQIEVESLFALCASYTVKMAENVGYQTVTSIGDNGNFPYPKKDFIATALRLPDIHSLEYADENEKLKINRLREKQNFDSFEKTRNGGELKIQFNLKIS